MLYLFKIQRVRPLDEYGIYNGAIVAAHNGEEAKRIHPGSENLHATDEDFWQHNTEMWDYDENDWPRNPADITVTYVGTAHKDIRLGVVLADYNPWL